MHEKSTKNQSKEHRKVTKCTKPCSERRLELHKKYIRSA